MKKITIYYFFVHCLIFTALSTYGQRSCDVYSESFSSLNFENPVLDSGSNNGEPNIGDVYRFINVAPSIDALVTISQLNNGATLQDFDRPAATEGSDGYDRAFQPTLNTNGNNNANALFNIVFVRNGTNNNERINLNFFGSILDVDGDNNNLREFAQVSPLPASYSYNNPTRISFANNATILQGRASTTATEPGTSVNPENAFSIYYENVSEFNFLIGNNGTTTSNRQFALLLEDISYNNRTENNFSSPLICGKVLDDLGNPIPGVTINLGGAESATTTTDFDGSFSFTTNKTGVVNESLYTITATTPSGYLFVSDTDGGGNGINRSISTMSSRNNTFVFGQDSDGDGTTDGQDLDKDNDGILDQNEGFCTPAQSGNWGGLGTQTATFNYGNGVTARITTNSTTNFSSEAFNPNGANFWSRDLAGDVSLNNVYNWGSTLTVEFIDSATGDPVTVRNPEIHFDRIGGSSGGFQNAAEVTLQGGLSWVKLQGTDDFLVTSNTATDQGAGTAPGPGYSAESSQDDVSGTASGSLRIVEDVSTIQSTRRFRYCRWY